LDEVGELTLETQGILLRALQESRIRPVGAKEEAPVDVRIISATNRNLPGMVRNGEFREDLFYRLNVFPIYVPPLRERPEDIPDIANYIWRELRKEELSGAQLDALRAYSWPGNMRELDNFLCYADVLDSGDFGAALENFRKMSVQTDTIPVWGSAGGLSDNLEDAVKGHITAVLEKHGGNITTAAKALGITRNTLKKHLQPRQGK
jgi:transcriptional regulator with PAS, ATPase and Fis domain